jgi:hypothetical protein
VSSSLTPKLFPPPVRLRLLIPYIYGYSIYVEAVSPIRNVRKRHAVVTTDSLHMVFLSLMKSLSLLWVSTSHVL